MAMDDGQRRLRVEQLVDIVTDGGPGDGATTQDARLGPDQSISVSDAGMGGQRPSCGTVGEPIPVAASAD